MTKNMTSGSPTRLILAFTIPLLIGNLFQQFYNMADTFIVGRTINQDALAAVGCTSGLVFFIIGFVTGFTSGACIVTSQRFGRGDMEGVRRSFTTGVILSIGMTVVLTAVSVLLAKPILTLLHTPEKIYDDAYRYVIVIFWGIAASVLFNFFSNVMRAVGNSRTPLIFLAIACVINIVLDYALILIFHMGVAGAAVATVIAQVISGLLCIPYILKKLPVLKPTRQDWRISSHDLRRHIRLALPMGFQQSIIAIGSLVLQFALNNLGTTAVAAYTAASKIDSVGMMPVSSFGITMATYVAQNYGASEYHRIRQGLRNCALITVGLSLAIGAIFVFAGQYLAAIFVTDAAAIEKAHTYLMINGPAYFILALLFVFRYSLQGLGQSFVPTLAGVMELVMRAFAALVLAAPFGFTGVCFANPLAWLGSCIPLTISLILTLRRLPKKDMSPPPTHFESTKQT